VHYFAEQARAYWFLDLVMSEWQELVQRRAFLVINLLVSRKSAIIKVSDGNGSDVKNRHVKVTDCPDGNYKFFLLLAQTPF